MHFLSCQGNGPPVGPRSLPCEPHPTQRPCQAISGRESPDFGMFHGWCANDNYVFNSERDTFAPHEPESPHSPDIHEGTWEEWFGFGQEHNPRTRTKTAGQRFQRLITTSLTTFPLGPKGFCGLPFNSARTPPALPSVTVNWSWAFH